jgi:hypothetical protein
MSHLNIVMSVLVLASLFMGSGAYCSDGPPSGADGESLAVSVQHPNLFVLTGAGVKIAYSTSSLAGPPLLTYKDGKQTLTFQGDEIHLSDSDIGQQVTVILEQIPDLRTVTLTLLLPVINLDEPETRFRTIGIVATHLTSIGGPDLVNGVLQTYRAKDLKGIARFVIF